MPDKPFGRRTLLRSAGVLGAASVLPWPAGCGRDGDDALTFFFQANPEEADARMRIVDAFSRSHPDIGVRTVLSGPDPMQQVSTFCAGGKCPDVLMAWELTYAGLADRGVLLDLHHDAGTGSGLRRATEQRQHPRTVRDVHVRRRPVRPPGAVVGQLLVLQQETVRRGRPGASTARAGRQRGVSQSSSTPQRR